MNLSTTFDKFSKHVTKITGSHWGFIGACVILFTGDKIITAVGFLVLIFIQQSQNKDTKAIQLKLDEIIRAIEPADNKFRSIEQKTDAEIDKINEHQKEAVKKFINENY